MTIDFDRFTDSARKVMAMANQEAQRFNHEYIGTEHILLGLLKEGAGHARTILNSLNVDVTRLRDDVINLMRSGPEMSVMGLRPHTPRARKVVEFAMEEASRANSSHVGTEHLLLGLIRETDGAASAALEKHGVTESRVRDDIGVWIARDAVSESARPKIVMLEDRLDELKRSLRGSMNDEQRSMMSRIEEVELLIDRSRGSD